MGSPETNEKALTAYADYLWQQTQTVKDPVQLVDRDAKAYLFGALARWKSNLPPNLSLGEHFFSLGCDADVLIKPSSVRAFLALCEKREQVFRNLPLELEFSMALSFDVPFIRRASQYWIQLF